MTAKSLEELILGAENQEAASKAVQDAVERGRNLRREMVEKVNANQRLEGYEPDEHLKEIQERYILGELSTTEMLGSLIDHARSIQRKSPK
jgi:hypothetical protein